MAGRQTLDDYVKRFADRRDRYQRMIFAVHSPRGELCAPMIEPVQVWDGPKVAELVGSCPQGWCSFQVSHLCHRLGPGRSGYQGWQADGGIIADRGDAFQRHVAGALDGPFVVLFE